MTYFNDKASSNLWTVLLSEVWKRGGREQTSSLEGNPDLVQGTSDTSTLWRHENIFCQSTTQPLASTLHHLVWSCGSQFP